jgi:hypothetical protein
MGKKKSDVPTIPIELEILIHPDLELDVKELEIEYSLDDTNDFIPYTANKVNDKKYLITLYDIPSGSAMEFYLRFIKKDGELVLGKKEENNYKVQIRENAEGKYKAQIRITEQNLVEVGRKCLVCSEVLKKGKHVCSKCNANYCPKCTRMLPPNKNFCPWCKIKLD